MILLYTLNERSASTELVLIDKYVRAISANAGVRVLIPHQKASLQPAHQTVLVTVGYDYRSLYLNTVIAEHLRSLQINK